MNIGIDIDGVLTNIEKFQREEGLRFSREKGWGEMVNPNAFETRDMFGWTVEQDNEFWDKELWEYAKSYPVREYASEVTNKLKCDGHYIYIITARTHGIEKRGKNATLMHKLVKEWLAKNRIAYDKLIFTKDDKFSVIKTMDLDVMIEDKPLNVELVSTIMPVICMHADYNAHLKQKNIFRVKNWKNVLDIIDKLNYSTSSN